MKKVIASQRTEQMVRQTDRGWTDRRSAIVLPPTVVHIDLITHLDTMFLKEVTVQSKKLFAVPEGTVLILYHDLKYKTH